MKMYMYFVIIILSMFLLVSCGANTLPTDNISDVVIKDNSSLSENVPDWESSASQSIPSGANDDSGIEFVLPQTYAIENILKDMPGSFSKNEVDAEGTKYLSALEISGDATSTVSTGIVYVYAYYGQWVGCKIELELSGNAEVENIGNTITPYIQAIIGRTLSEDEKSSLIDILHESTMTTDMSVTTDIPSLVIESFVENNQMQVQIVPAD